MQASRAIPSSNEGGIAESLVRCGGQVGSCLLSPRYA
jgi:hypothetical protein